MTGQDALKACAHCGGAEIFSSYVSGMVSLWQVRCRACGIKVEVGCKPFDRDARAAAQKKAETIWNTRSPVCEDARGELVEAAALIAEAKFRELTQQYQKPAGKDAMVAFDIAKEIRALAKSLPSLLESEGCS